MSPTEIITGSLLNNYPVNTGQLLVKMWPFPPAKHHGCKKFGRMNPFIFQLPASKRVAGLVHDIVCVHGIMKTALFVNTGELNGTGLEIGVLGAFADGV